MTSYQRMFVLTTIETDKSVKNYICIVLKKKSIIVSCFHLSPRHLKLPEIGPLENTQRGLQRTTNWTWERRVEQHLVLDPRRSQVSVNRITGWMFKFSAIGNNLIFLLRIDRVGSSPGGNIVLCS